MRKRNLLALAAVGSLLVCPSCQTGRQNNISAPQGRTEIPQNADPATREIAERELIRRKQALRDADVLMEEGEQLMQGGDLEGATRTFRRAVDTIP